MCLVQGLNLEAAQLSQHRGQHAVSLNKQAFMSIWSSSQGDSAHDTQMARRRRGGSLALGLHAGLHPAAL